MPDLGSGWHFKHDEAEGWLASSIWGLETTLEEVVDYYERCDEGYTEVFVVGKTVFCNWYGIASLGITVVKRF